MRQASLRLQGRKYGFANLLEIGRMMSGCDRKRLRRHGRALGGGKFQERSNPI